MTLTQDRQQSLPHGTSEYLILSAGVRPFDLNVPLTRPRPAAAADRRRKLPILSNGHMRLLIGKENARWRTVWGHGLNPSPSFSLPNLGPEHPRLLP